MVNLRTNIRNYREPFILRQTIKTIENGVAVVKFKPSIIIYGNLVDTQLLSTQGDTHGGNSDLSIKIRRTSLKININDAIIYNSCEYVIKHIMRDRYSYNENIIRCEFVKFIDNEEEPEDKINYSLDFLLWG